MKMTFKKKDPELVTLFFVAPDLPLGKPRQYRVSKRQEFVSALQVRLRRSLHMLLLLFARHMFPMVSFSVLWAILP